MIKKILVVSPGPVYPVRSMSQMRTHNMLRTLSREFSVDLLTPYTNDENFEESKKALKETGGEYIPILSAKHNRNKLRKRLSQASEYLQYYIFGIDREVTSYKRNIRRIVEIITERNYKVVISNYWEGSLFFMNLGAGVFKILDPHYAVGENFDVLERKKNRGVTFFLEKRRLKNNLRMERKVIGYSDLLLPLSERNRKEFEKVDPQKPMLYVADGADLDYFLNFRAKPQSDTVLFYGAMGSEQNKQAFWRLFHNILPQLKKNFPRLKLLVVGNNPSYEIKSLHNGKDIIVTGFVDDVRPWLGQAWLSIIPLELGSGFRGRVIELMAMGIPVIGTHNALESIGFENGKHGFISDSDDEMISFCNVLLNDAEKRKTIANNALEFVKANYSIEATFGKLNNYLLSLKL